jgi:hypothetical protein
MSIAVINVKTNSKNWFLIPRKGWLALNVKVKKFIG